MAKILEKEILCDLIEKYIEIANINNTTLDDYISIISLIQMLQVQYKEYINDFQMYIREFDKNGIMHKYQTYFKNTAKQIFIENDWKPNVDLAYDMLYGFFDGCTNRFMHLLIIFGLCGKPTTQKQKYIMSSVFVANSSIFENQKIYYSKMYIDAGIYVNNNSIWIDKKQKKNYIKSQYCTTYKNIALAYRNKKDDKNFEKYMLKAEKYHDCANDELARFYIKNKNFQGAEECIKKIISGKKHQAKQEGYIYNLENDIYTKQLVEYYNFRVKYPYIRKELLEIFNIDIKTFNRLVESIKDDEEYKKNSNYSNKIIDYLKNKLNK